ncbi:MAG: F0F1 ATP synthase subunit delta [Coriobacteriales bacterium]|jgi:F-type H+-transporting ATPase subunit delta|nr:F0F1 ATP synthase subunit delta [Coriobacteriales bacterium]
MRTNPTVDKAKAAVYAEVLLEAGRQAGTDSALFELTGQFEQLLKTVRGSLELRSALSDQGVDPSVRRTIANDVFAGLRPELLVVFGTMVERDDLRLLSRTVARFVHLAEDALGAVIIDVTTVVPLSDELRFEIIDKYAAQLGTGVLLREHKDPALIGGIVLSMHGKRIDASVSSQLENARVELSRQ